MTSANPPRDQSNPLKFKARLLVFLVISFIFFWNAFQTPNVHYTFGDTQTQMFTISAFKHFADNGFLDSKLSPRTPSRQEGSSFNRLGDYIHYPPLPYYVNGLPYALGITTLKAFKIWMYFFAFLGLIAAYLFLEQTFGWRVAAPSILGVFIFSPFWETYIENGTRIDVPLLFFGLLAYSFHLDSGKPGYKSKYFWLSYALYFLCSYASFEYTMAFGLIAFGLSLCRAPGVFLSRNSFVDLALLASCPVTSLLVHLLNNAWYLGGLELAIADLRQAFFWRTLETVDSPIYPIKFLKRAVGDGTFTGWVWRNLFKSYGLVSAGILAAAFRWYLVFKQKFLSREEGIKLAMFFFALPSFVYVFRQATVIEWAISHSVHFLFPVSMFFVGVLLYPVRGLGLSWLARNSNSLSKGIIVICLLYSAQQTLSFLVDRPSKIFTEEVKILASVKTSLDEKGMEPIQKAVLLTDKSRIAAAAFKHNPRSFFGVTEADVFYVPNAKDFGNFLKANRNYYDREKVFYVSTDFSHKPEFLKPAATHESYSSPYLLKIELPKE